MQTVRYGILPYAAILVVICGLTALERHFSGVLIILALGATMMFLGGVEMKWFLIGGALVGGVCGDLPCNDGLCQRARYGVA